MSLGNSWKCLGESKGVRNRKVDNSGFINKQTCERKIPRAQRFGPGCKSFGEDS